MTRIATVLCLVVLVVTSGCRDEEAAPVEAAREFVAAVQRRDVRALMPLIDPGAVKRLKQAAERASNQVGGRRSIEAWEMLQVVDVDPTFQIASTEVVRADAEQAEVRLIGADGSEHLLLLVYEDRWRVRIPRPR